MPSQFTTDSMELMLTGFLAVFAVAAVLFPVVGTIAYLLTRDEGTHAPAVPRVVATPTPTISKGREPGFPAAIAG